MYKSIDDITMNSTMAINHMFKSKPLLWNNSFSKSPMGNDFFYSNDIVNVGFHGQPRRVSLNQRGSNGKIRKSVRFSSQLIIDTESDKQEEPAKTPWYGALTEEHCNELWYQKRELLAIKQAAKVLIVNRSKIQKNPNASSEELDNLVGLERFSRQRAGWKKNNIRFVLMAQNQMRELQAQSINAFHNINKEDYIRDVSLRCSEWSREAAEEQGFCDYCAVHDPLASLFSDDKKEKQNYNELIFGERTVSNSNNKRNFEQTQIDSVRRVRSRTEILQSV